jgi:hypothetical protein
MHTYAAVATTHLHTHLPVGYLLIAFLLGLAAEKIVEMFKK